MIIQRGLALVGNAGDRRQFLTPAANGHRHWHLVLGGMAAATHSGVYQRRFVTPADFFARGVGAFSDGRIRVSSQVCTVAGGCSQAHLIGFAAWNSSGPGTCAPRARAASRMHSFGQLRHRHTTPQRNPRGTPSIPRSAASEQVSPSPRLFARIACRRFSYRMSCSGDRHGRELGPRICVARRGHQRSPRAK